jgi:putative ABC transport system permease protein
MILTVLLYFIFVTTSSILTTAENISEALKSVKSNRLRAFLTILIIAFGIMAIVGVLTAIEGIRGSLESSFTTLGSNTFKIQNYESTVKITSGGGRRAKKKPMPEISYYQAAAFKRIFSGEAPVSVTFPVNFAAKARHLNYTSNNNLDLKGVDENFLLTESFFPAEGRIINKGDVEMARNVAVIGDEVKKTLFPFSSAIGKEILVDGSRYTVIGVFQPKGATFGTGGDKIICIPVTTAMKDYNTKDLSFGISVFVKNPERMNEVIDEAIGRFRIIRGMKPGDEEDFSIAKSDTFVNSLLDSLIALRIAAISIAIITLLGASIGLMNIMLVSVTERTREIGIRKALGATRKNILFQFLTEALVICQLGGLLGILLGVGIGNVIGLFLNSPFIAPWEWMLLGVSICFVVGLASGIYPARKASMLDPIDALRHE